MLLFFWLDGEECEVVLVNFASGLMKTTVFYRCSGTICTQRSFTCLKGVFCSWE